ncbi:MAG TPA: S26 family signal peptidase [Micromonosporaceae bacterium]|jgi:signal peptidase I
MRAALIATGGVLLVVLVGLLVRRRVFVVAVVGRSMTPTYTDGERLLAVRGRRVSPGDVVVFTIPPAARDMAAEDASISIKRVSAVSSSTGPVTVTGDAPRSLDSRVFGPLDRDLIIGRVLRPRPRR